jgi:ubiquinone/menaquinone biosynthesis C-methylase UbiE
MEQLPQILSLINAGRVLDIATGQGGFADLLDNHLDGYTHITGVDISFQALQTARQSVHKDRFSISHMDAACLAFPDRCFDTVTISVSLHHIPTIPAVFTEILRVLRPGGRMIISEMYCDGQTEAQQTVVEIHHWAADVDTALGIPHNHTFTRQEILDMIASLGLQNTKYYDLVNPQEDPKNPESIQQSNAAIDMVLQRAQRLPDYNIFFQTSQALRQRLNQVGCQTPSILFTTGVKP